MTANPEAKGQKLLEDLKSHVADLQASIAAAENETREQVQARITQVAQALESATAEVEGKAAEASAEAQSRWDAFKSMVQVKKEDITQRIDERALELDVKRAIRAAENAEQLAADSIDFALLSIQNSWVFVLDAIDARLYAEDLTGLGVAPADD